MSINIKLDAVCDGQHKHPTITEDGLVTDINSICCLQPQEISAYVKSPRSILVPETETIRFEEKLLWVGLVNGEKGIGVMKEHDSTSLYHNDQDKFCKTTDLKYFLPLFKVQLILLKEMKNYINYDEIGIKISNPIKITKIEIDDKINKLIKIHKYGSDNFVRVKDKVSVNDISCLCCIDLIGTNDKMPDETRINGMFYIPVNEMESCFKFYEPQNHFQLNIADSGVKYESVCCIEVMDQLVGYPWIRDNSELIKGDKKYKCKWIGKMNEEDIVGIESNTNLLDVNKKLSNLVVRGNEKLIFYRASTFKYGIKKSASLGSNIIDHTVLIYARNLREIEASRIVYVYVGNDRRRGVVKVIGNVNGNEIVGCEMNTKFDDGTDGTVGGTKLFYSGDKRGVLIVQDDKLRCCEVDGRHNEVEIDRNGMIIDTKFCCIERRNEIEGYEEVIKDDNYSWNNGEGWIVTCCDEIAIVNGCKPVGLFHETQRNSKYYFALDNLNKDIVLCDVVNILIIKPESVKLVENEEVINKYLIITIENKTIQTVKAKWKGLINGTPVIGCQLKMASDYGTDGEFNDHELFSCDDGRGVLMVLDGLTKTCANGCHEELQIDPNRMIKEENICCVEHGDWKKSKFKKRKKLSLNSDPLEKKGVCKWIGKINGQSCVGIESDKSINEGCDGKLCGIELFRCNKGCSFITKEENVKI